MKKLYAIIALALVFALQAIPAAAEPMHTKHAIERWIVQETKDTVNLKTVHRIIDAVLVQARRHGIDPYLILSTIRQESRFQVSAQSGYGAKGLMQVVPKWHRDKIAGRNINHIETNIEVGTQVLVDCLDKHHQIVAKALRCYSGGARNYESKLRLGHKSMVRAEVLYRFENELPINPRAKFDKPFQYALAPESEKKEASAEYYALR